MTLGSKRIQEKYAILDLSDLLNGRYKHQKQVIMSKVDIELNVKLNIQER